MTKQMFGVTLWFILNILGTAFTGWGIALTWGHSVIIAFVFPVVGVACSWAGLVAWLIGSDTYL
jgi:hypothetical protein